MKTGTSVAIVATAAVANGYLVRRQMFGAILAPISTVLGAGLGALIGGIFKRSQEGAALAAAGLLGFTIIDEVSSSARQKQGTAAYDACKARGGTWDPQHRVCL